MPNSSPTTAADLPLLSQFWTASRLKVWSNFRRFWTDVVLMDLIIHDFVRFSVRQIEATSKCSRLHKHDDANDRRVGTNETTSAIWLVQMGAAIPKCLLRYCARCALTLKKRFVVVVP